MSDSLISDPCHERSTTSGKFYDIEYYCSTDEELAQVDQQHGDFASWAPETAYVSDRDLTRLINNGPPYLLKLSASPSVSGGSSQGYLNPRNYNNYSLRNYLESEILIKPEWFGMRKATQSDVEEGIKNPDDQACRKDEYIFNNATSASKGTYTISIGCPFTDSGMSNTIAKNKAGQKIKTVIFQSEFYSNSDINRFANFQGVQNVFYSSRGRPFTTGSNKWRAHRQELGEIVDDNGNIKTHVVRRYELAPNPFVWDSSKV